MFNVSKKITYTYTYTYSKKRSFNQMENKNRKFIW